MALNVTLTQLSDRVLLRANMPNSGFVLAPELTALINTHRRRLHLRIAQAVPFYFRTTATITTVAGTLTYALPSDYLWTQVVYVVEASTYRRPIRRITDFARVSYTAPQGVYSLEHVYTPVPTDLATGSDTVDGVIGYDEWIVCAAARSCLVKQGTDIGPISAELADIERDIISSLTCRDQGSPTYITEIENSYDWPWPYAQSVNGFNLAGAYIELYQSSPVTP